MTVFGIHIDFAYRTFRWDSEANLKAHVHCVIVGFSVAPNNAEKRIYSEEHFQMAENINAYLMDAPTVFIESRSKSLCEVPEMLYGNKPTDGGFLFLTNDEYQDVQKREPEILKYIRRVTEHRNLSTISLVFAYGSLEYLRLKFENQSLLWKGLSLLENFDWQVLKLQLEKVPKCPRFFKKYVIQTVII